MPRRARMHLPGYPYHIVQRGNNREACFVEPENYPYYLELWKENACKKGTESLLSHIIYTYKHQHCYYSDQMNLNCKWT